MERPSGGHPDQSPEGVTAFPNRLFTEIRPLLSIAQWSVLSAIAFRVLWAGAPVVLSYHTIATEANVDRRTVIDAVAVLVDLGVLRKRLNESRHNVYDLAVTE